MWWCMFFLNESTVFFSAALERLLHNLADKFMILLNMQ